MIECSSLCRKVYILLLNENNDSLASECHQKPADLHVEPLAGAIARPSVAPREVLAAMTQMIRNIFIFLDLRYIAKTRVAMIAAVVYETSVMPKSSKDFNEPCIAHASTTIPNENDSAIWLPTKKSKEF